MSHCCVQSVRKAGGAGKVWGKPADIIRATYVTAKGAGGTANPVTGPLRLSPNAASPLTLSGQSRADIPLSPVPSVTLSGEVKESILLVCGFWGIVRHFNYMPELAAAFLWSLPCLFASGLPYFYFVFLVILLSDRARRDDGRCRSKYGHFWDEYCKRVPYKMIPFVY